MWSPDPFSVATPHNTVQFKIQFIKISGKKGNCILEEGSSEVGISLDVGGLEVEQGVV